MSTIPLSSSSSSSSDFWLYSRGIFSGTASGITKLIVGHPFDTIKVRMQIEGMNGRFNGPLDCLKQTIRKEGIRGLYKGATPPLIGWGLIDSLLWGSLIQYRHFIQSYHSNIPLSLTEHAIAGTLAG